MFCYQCQETVKNQGCTMKGVCGKTDEVANLQDLLIHLLKGVAYFGTKAAEKGIDRADESQFVLQALFTTITNVNFNPVNLHAWIREAIKVRDGLKHKVGSFDNMPDAAVWYSDDDAEFAEKAKEVGYLSIANDDIRSLKALLIFGLKGMAAYAEHAAVLDEFDQKIYDYMFKALSATLREDIGADELIGLVMECGSVGVQTMALLDKANTERYGHPEPTQVQLGVKKNPAILISGHDLRDLEELLDQTKGTGIDVYTHGEMLPANAYPFFKKYDNLAGNYGGSWFHQQTDFEKFNGVILMTTNCLVPPRESYINRVFNTGVVSYPGIKYIPMRKKGEHKDFTALIEMAKTLPSPEELETGTVWSGFARNTVMGVADKVIAAVKSGAIKKFVVMGGCDGRHKERSYFTEIAEKLPMDTIILTAGCAKYRYNKLPLGDIAGIPRVLDAGQCNDCYSLAYIALQLKAAFGLDDINDLPISYDIAWYEQKAVLVLLALLSLGVKNINLGPTLPAFLSPNVAKVLVEKFNIGQIGTVEGDLKKFM